ncbi:hypothetical protein [Malonomonas rubra]|uniref:hypothetical protein n=1 Tax=Malonomonas rubra TaxID=57040 RepID=UPI0026EA6EF6|nr:hypothetical protein [Malonomonas rubra]
MSRYEDKPLKHVLTFRINDDEKDIVKEMITISGTNVSTLLRKVLRKHSKSFAKN